MTWANIQQCAPMHCRLTDLSCTLLQSLTLACRVWADPHMCHNVLFALLTNWLPSICSCRQISNIAWTGSFPKGLAYNHLTMWTMGTSCLFPTKSCTHRESLNEEATFSEQGQEKATPFLKMERRTWTTCILTPTHQFPIGQAHSCKNQSFKRWGGWYFQSNFWLCTFSAALLC